MIVPFFVDRTDTVAVLVANKVNVVSPVHREWLTPVLVILGWIVVHLLQRRLQREQFFLEIVHSTSQAVNEELIQYERWNVQRAVALNLLYDRGELQQDKVAELEQLMRMPVAQRWLSLIEGGRYVLDGVVDNLEPRMNALGARHAAILPLMGKAIHHESLVERLQARTEAHDGAISLANAVRDFRLEMLRHVAQRIKPRDLWGWWRKLRKLFTRKGNKQ